MARQQVGAAPTRPADPRIVSDTARVVVVANYAAAPANLPTGTVVISTSGT